MLLIVYKMVGMADVDHWSGSVTCILMKY